MNTVALVIGHGPRIDKGAENHDGTTELAWNKDLGERLKDFLEPSIHINPVLIYRRVENIPPVQSVNEIGADLAIELHLNAHYTYEEMGFNEEGEKIVKATPSSASGTEMIHYPGSAKGTRLAALLLNAAVGVLQLPNRGVNTRWAGRGIAFLRGTRCTALIVESFLISNDHDLRVGNANKQRLVQAYADALHRYFNP